jgi:hypothetical protein
VSHDQTPSSPRLPRRTVLKWFAAVAAATQLPDLGGTVEAAAAAPAAKGYGMDPDLSKFYQPGDFWPLTLTPAQRRTAAALCDVLIPADSGSPSAASVGVVDFIDEWVSAPYPQQQGDRPIVIEGLAWIDDEARRRYTRSFADLDMTQQSAICDDIAYEPRVHPSLAKAALFFARYRDLTAGGFYSTPEGRKDLQYIGNVALARFDGPSLEVLRKVGLDEAPT